ncbi:MAG TPA: efflux RND transporter permease subunit, partial [Candidatus Krumholzibacterium sp.]|nr:efflux RND transporter permease subunit [Candidatus Krumholzibacterium sp.]
KRDIYPQVDFGVMNITTRYPGASPEDVELNVTNKIEEELKSVVGIQQFTSISMENISQITVTIDLDAKDHEKIKTEVRDAVSRVTDFPDEVTESPLVVELNSTGVMEIIEVGLSSVGRDYRDLRERARLFEKKLKAVPGVSRLERAGYRTREVRVEVSPDAIERYQIPMREIISAIQRRNIRGTTGSFESYTSDKNLVTLAQFRHPAEVGDVIVRSTFDGPLIRVKDLAFLSDDFEDERLLSRMNGVPAISFVVYISEAADVIRTTDAIKDLVENEKKTMPEDIRVLYSNDSSRIVRESFDVVLSNGWIGLVLVVLLLPIFLTFRTSFWIAMGIPTAFLGTIFVLPMFGMYLDTITLSGMILIIGIIVDDAIIVSENITRRREMGDGPLDAAVTGINEVFKPVLTTVLTTFLVFAPMFFMPGVFGKYIVPIPLAISLALCISLLEVMIVLPAHLAHGMRNRPGKAAGRKWFSTLSEHYRRFLNPLLRFRYVLVLLFVAVLAGSLWYARNNIKFVLFPSETADHFYIGTEQPIGTPLLTTADRIKAIERLVEQLPKDELSSFTTRIGTNPFIHAEVENYAYISINLTPYTKRTRTAEEIVESLREKTDSMEDLGKVLFEIVSGGPPVGKPVSLRIVGSDDRMRTELADSVAAYLSGIAGVKDITRDDVKGKDQVEIRIDYDKLARLGLTVSDLAQNVRIAYDGEVVTSVRYGDEDVDFRVIVQDKARRKLSYLKELLIPNQQGRLIPLKEVATLISGPGQADFRHHDGERTVTVEADLEQDTTTPLEVTDRILAHFDLDRDWPGMKLGLGGEIFETEKSMAGLYRAMVIAVIGIYFLLVLLFNSVVQPLLVMVAIPFGIIGVIFAFAFHGEPLSFMGIMGVIGLSGVVVNDSLVLVSHLNEQRKMRPEENLHEIVAEGTANRLRAIIMTTLTTVAALLPLAYGIGGTAVFMAPMALALGWGLVFATPLTLVLVPSLYLIWQDMSRVFRIGVKKE